MITGKVVERFTLSDSKVVFRYPRLEDLEGLLELVNAIVEDKAMVASQEMKTREEELDWLSNLLKNVEKSEVVHLVVEVNGEILGNTQVERDQKPFDHVGTLGIMLHRKIRGRGIGEKLFRRIIEEARHVLGVRIIMLKVMGDNEVAQRLYRKCGFEEIGRIRDGVKHYENLQDDVIMVKYL